MYEYYAGPRGEEQVRDRNENSLQVDLSLENFAEGYLLALKSNLSSFRHFFTGLLFLYGTLTLFLICLIVVLFDGSGILALLQSVPTILNFAVLVWLAEDFCGDFVKLQVSKTENALINTISFRGEATKMNKKILEQAEKRAGHTITLHGDNAILAIDGSSVSDVRQTKTVQGDPETIKSLALLIAYCQETGNSVAISASQEMAAEATKNTPNRGKIFSFWNTIVAAIPSILSTVKIVEGVKALM